MFIEEAPYLAQQPKTQDVQPLGRVVQIALRDEGLALRFYGHGGPGILEDISSAKVNALKDGRCVEATV